ncbi:MAG: pitrilysin family protein [Bacilli bacterium]
MKNKEIQGIDLQLYSKTLDNGLQIYIVPFSNVNNTYVTYSTKYGGINNEFIPINEKEKVKVPLGIAHFLEHKMFESEGETDIFNFFQESGSNCNANTSNRKTSYLFSGPNAFYENLEFLLKYVEEPYFTDSNVQKEKGIIEQEIKMYQDNPYSRMYEGLMFNTFINHPLKYPTIGTKESIYSITKENLYTCYNTFYHPSNMFIIVTGNVDPEKTMEVIEKHENKRKIKKISLNNNMIKINEPDKVEKEEEIIKMDVTLPKLAVAFKINITKLKMNENDIYQVLLNAVDLKIGTTSLFTEELRNLELITDTFDVTGVKAEDHLVIIVDTETNYPEKVFDLLMEELSDLNIKEQEFNRRKKTGISGLLFASDNIFRINSKLASDIMERGNIDYSPIKTIKEITYEDLEYIIKNISLKNYSKIFVLPE